MKKSMIFLLVFMVFSGISCKNTKPSANEIFALIGSLTNDFRMGEDPARVWYERNVMVTSLILEYIRNNGENITDDLIESIPVDTSYTEPYGHDSPDGLFHIYRWFIPYARTVGTGSIDRFWDGSAKLDIVIIQYETASGGKITFSMHDIIRQIEISDVPLRESVNHGFLTMYFHTVPLGNSMYLLGCWFRDPKDRRNLGLIFLVIKREEGRFVLHNAFNNEMYVLLFTDTAGWDTYAIDGFEAEPEYILFHVKKIIGGEAGQDRGINSDTYIYDQRDIRLSFNGNEFAGDYERLFEVSREAEH